MKYAKLLLAAAFCAAGTFIAAQGPAKTPEKKVAPAVKKAEPRKAEPKKAEPRKAEPKKAEPKKAEPKKAEPRKAEPRKAEPRKAEPKKAEPKKAEPKKAEPKKAEPKKAEPRKAEPKKAEPRKAEPKKAEPGKPAAERVPAPIPDYKPAPKKPAPEKKAPVYKISRLIPYVLIVTNYGIPRFLAEYCCKNLNIPYLMIVDKTPKPDANARIALCLPKAKEPIWLTAKDLSRLLAYMRPREVILLGDADKMPTYYRKAVPETSRMFVVNDTDWSENTLRLSSIIRADRLKKAYRDYIIQRDREHEQKRKNLKNAQENLRRSEEAMQDTQGY